MTDIRTHPGLDNVIQDWRLRREAVLSHESWVHFRKGSPDHVGRRRPPNEAEKAELLELVREMGLSGEFDVVTDRVFFERTPGGMDGFTELTELTKFYLFRRQDVPYLMSLKLAVDMMGT